MLALIPVQHSKSLIPERLLKLFLREGTCYLLLCLKLAHQVANSLPLVPTAVRVIGRTSLVNFSEDNGLGMYMIRTAGFGSIQARSRIAVTATFHGHVNYK